MNQLRSPGPKEGSGRQKTEEEGEVAKVALEISDTSEETVNINETTVKETEPAENAENTEKLGNGIMVYEIFFSLWLWRICSLIVISATEPTLLKLG